MMFFLIGCNYVTAVMVQTLLSVTVTWGKATEDVAIPSSFCDVSSMEVDAVHIYDIKDELRHSCSVTLRADLERFIVGISHIELSCGQYIKLYYNSNTRDRPDKVYDCTSQRSDYLFTPSKYLTVNFEKPLGKQKYNFSIIVTSYEPGFFCDHDQMYCTYRDQEMCIDSDIRCDGIKNCPDAKDEELCSKPRCFGSCRFSNDVIDAQSGNMAGISTGILITIILIAVTVLMGLIVGIACCFWRKRHHRQGHVIRRPPPTTTQQSVQNAMSADSPLIYYPTGTQPPPAGIQHAPEASYPHYQPVPAAPRGQGMPGHGFQHKPVGHAQGPSAGEETAFPPPAPYNPEFGLSTQPPPYHTPAVASAPPVDQ